MVLRNMAAMERTPGKVVAVHVSVLADAREQERQEEFIAERVAAGDPIEGLFPLSEARRDDYEAWLAQRPPPEAHPDAARWPIRPVTTGSMFHRAGGPPPSPGTADAGDADEAGGAR